MFSAIESTVVVMALVKIVSVSSTPTLLKDWTCEAGPEFTFTMEHGVVGGRVYVHGFCDFGFINETTAKYTINEETCIEVPEFNEEFTVIVQEHSDFFIEGEHNRIESHTCLLDLENIGVTAGVDIGFSPDDVMAISIRRPGLFHTYITTKSDQESSIAGGVVGDDVILHIMLTEPNDAALYSFYILTLTETTVSATMISGGCVTQSDVFYSQPAGSSAGKLAVPYYLFRPYVSIYDDENVVAHFSITLAVCEFGDPCAPSCGEMRRRRAATTTNSTNIKATAKLQTSIAVHRQGTVPEQQKQTNGLSGNSNDDKETICIARAPMFGLLLGIGIALILSLCTSAWLFWKQRKANNQLKRKQAYSNKSYRP